VKSQFGIDTFDNIISYMPNAEIPLTQYKFQHIWHNIRNLSSTNDGAKRLSGDFQLSRHHKHLRLAATIINVCETPGNREGYINEMKKYVNVHVYGDCGAPCPGKTEEDCVKYLSKFYTFLLIFETHICQHYLSPQLFRVLQLPLPVTSHHDYSKNTTMVPVVFGGINYNELFSKGLVLHKVHHTLSTNSKNSFNEALSHDNMKKSVIKSGGKKYIEPTFGEQNVLLTIDALGQSPRSLAHYLKHLASSSNRHPGDGGARTAMLYDYLKWKNEYEIHVKEWPCELCERLRKHKKTAKRTYGDDARSKNIMGLNKKVSTELCTSWPTLDFSGAVKDKR